MEQSGELAGPRGVRLRGQGKQGGGGGVVGRGSQESYTSLRWQSCCRRCERRTYVAAPPNISPSTRLCVCDPCNVTSAITHCDTHVPTPSLVYLRCLCSVFSPQFSHSTVLFFHRTFIKLLFSVISADFVNSYVSIRIALSRVVSASSALYSQSPSTRPSLSHHYLLARDFLGFQRCLGT